VLDGTDVGDDSDEATVGVVVTDGGVVGGAADCGYEQPASTRAASTRTLRTSPGCPIADFTRLSYMVKLTTAAPNRNGRDSQE
jgi:hypothetical protein